MQVFVSAVAPLLFRWRARGGAAGTPTVSVSFTNQEKHILSMCSLPALHVASIQTTIRTRNRRLRRSRPRPLPPAPRRSVIVPRARAIIIAPCSARSGISGIHTVVPVRHRQVAPAAVASVQRRRRSFVARASKLGAVALSDDGERPLLFGLFATLWSVVDVFGRKNLGLAPVGAHLLFRADVPVQG